MGFGIMTMEALREYNRKIQEINSDPSHPEYDKRVQKAKDEYAEKIRKIVDKSLGK